MGNIQSICKTNFETIQQCVKNKSQVILITTLKDDNQRCLIKATLSVQEEVNHLNMLLSKNKKKEIIIYGKNHSDDTIYSKYNQLKNLGFTNVTIYLGGMFEWLCLQEIYGKELFPTEGDETDILKYK